MSGPEVIKLEFILKLKIKSNDWQPSDTCLSASSQSLRFILSSAVLSPHWVHMTFLLVLKNETKLVMLQDLSMAVKFW